MSSPAEFSKSFPPLTKAYGTLCLLATTVYQIGLFDTRDIALVHNWYSHVFRFGVQLENRTFDRWTADFLWMMIFVAFSLLVLSAIPIFWSPFFAISLVFMLLYIWSREFPNAQVNVYVLVTLKAFYIPWAMLALDVIFGSHIMPDLLGIIAGHLYYFLIVLHPLAGGNILKTAIWVYPNIFGHKLVARWQTGAQPTSHGQPERTTGVSFRGRAY